MSRKFILFVCGVGVFGCLVSLWMLVTCPEHNVLQALCGGALAGLSAGYLLGLTTNKER